ncbi:putative disease resistance protein [Tripterygium wilfordii]|uniref:Putative disease resistance protein n=1 Tax=Tripterygium wilfordii TaxID=458696 RepID=A0A7J7CP14_TRIWF|nr:putative disease resistance protein At4g19050 [Tripterygium wilfordii]KAF5735817.1 putative disease resistance protein [Tripterygium wilfordii]
MAVPSAKMETAPANPLQDMDLHLPTVENEISDILRMLSVRAETVVVGDAGIGKTWIAREISARAIGDRLYFETVWVSMNIKQEKHALVENIARQLSLHCIAEEWEDDDVTYQKNGEDDVKEEQKNQENHLSSLRQQICKKLGELSERKECLLLILDDEGSKMKQKEVLEEFPNFEDSLKLLIIRRKTSIPKSGEIKNNDPSIPESSEITSDSRPISNPGMIELQPLTDEESERLLKRLVQSKISGSGSFLKYSAAIAARCKGLPGAINVIAEALNHVDVTVLETALEEAADGSTPIICHAYDKLPTALIDCFWHSMNYFREFGGVHYNVLIAHWIIEGYFNHFDNVEKAYQKGHQVLTQLIDRGMLKMQDDNFVVTEGETLEMIDIRPRGFAGTACLGLPCVLAYEQDITGTDGTNVLGRITKTDGMIRTLRSSRVWEKITTILIDGSHFCREVPEKFFQRMEDLKVLALFDPMLKSLPSFSRTANLLVLVLRGCELLEDITSIAELKTLNALEISGSSSLTKIRDDFFKHMPQLRSLNLSALPIKGLPSSISSLNELRWFIVRECPNLETMPKLIGLKNLEVIDVSGAASLKSFQENFESLRKLQMLDVSDTRINKHPILGEIKELRRLIYRGCDKLQNLRHLKKLSGLQVLDLSCSAIRNLKEDSLGDIGLKILDLSGSEIVQLPSKLDSLIEIKLSGCLHITQLPCTTSFINLEKIDLSGAIKFSKIVDMSFGHMKKLWYLNFSNTKVEDLPSLSNLSNLQKLLLKGCSCLKNLPEMQGVQGLKVLDLSGCEQLKNLASLKDFRKLEVLDLSGCSMIQANENESLQHMCSLQVLNLDQCGATSLSKVAAESLEYLTCLKILKLSGIAEDIPSFSKVSQLSNLSELSLKGCSGLKNGQHVEVLSNLVVLDLSGTKFETPPSLDKFNKLCQLVLRGCDWVKSLPFESLIHLEILDLWGTKIEIFPYRVAELTQLKKLYLPNSKSIQEVDWAQVKRLPKEVNWEECGIPSKAHVNGSLTVQNFFEVLEQNPNLMDAFSKQYLYFSVCLLDEKAKDRDGYCHQKKPEGTNFQSQLLYSEKNKRCLEIHGTITPETFPNAFKNVLINAEYVSLIENMSGSLAAMLGASEVKKLEGCWLQGCAIMKSIFLGEDGDVGLGKYLKILWISNLPSLESVYKESVQPGSFENLKCLHLDCCPQLVDMFPASQLPLNLEVLRIKFCDNLQILFRRGELDKCSLGKLKTLHLLELPELSTIGVRLPSLENFDASECPKLEKRKEDLKVGMCECGKC